MRATTVAQIVLALLCAGLAAQEPPPADPLFREIAVPLRDGRLGLADLTRALLEAYEFDASGLDVPDRSVDVRGVRGHLLLLGARKALLDTVRFRRSLDDDTLVVVIDRERAREVRRELRGRVASLVGRFTGDDLLERSYVLDLPEELDTERVLVVLVHGVESSPDIWADLREYLRGRPRPRQTATFAYPNDESCEKVAAALAAELRALGEAPRIALVAHSMGGLIARAMLEDPTLDPGNVDTLIQIGTPNHGSDLAGFRFALEAAHLLPHQDGDAAFGRALLEGMRGTLLDGLGEAGGDLLPGSVFMVRLAKRDRNPRIRYHLVLGTRGVLSEAQLGAIRRRAAAVLGSSEATRAARPRIESWLGDLDELIDGEGDGAVSVASGRLDGVTPELVRLDHVGLVRWRGVLGRIARTEDHPVFSMIDRWLAATDRDDR